MISKRTDARLPTDGTFQRRNRPDEGIHAVRRSRGLRAAKLQHLVFKVGKMPGMGHPAPLIEGKNRRGPRRLRKLGMDKLYRQQTSRRAQDAAHQLTALIGSGHNPACAHTFGEQP